MNPFGANERFTRIPIFQYGQVECHQRMTGFCQLSFVNSEKHPSRAIGHVKPFCKCRMGEKIRLDLLRCQQALVLRGACHDGVEDNLAAAQLGSLHRRVCRRILERYFGAA